MEEVKQRVAILDGINKNQFQLPPIAAYELYWLELRMICELIALGCVAAHGSMPASYSKRLEKSHKPIHILTTLERIHPAFYPRPIKPNKQNRNPKFADLRFIEDGYLTKTDLLALHGRAGDMLHKGRIKKASPDRIVLDFGTLETWRNKIVTLLNHHFISLINKQTSYFVVMARHPDQKVTVMTVERLAAGEGFDDWLAG